MNNALLPTSELDAVNDMLDAIGETEVSSLEDLAPDAASALTTLRRTSREVQARGWHWNTSFRRLSATAQGEYILPSNTIKIDTVGKDRNVDVIIRGGKLYDRRPFKNTTVFEEKTLEVELVEMLRFEDLPEIARQFIYIRAARVFQEKEIGSTGLSRFDKADEKDARAELDRDQLNTADRTIIETMMPTLVRRPFSHFGRN